jgi:hypothetical protein
VATRRLTNDEQTACVSAPTPKPSPFKTLAGRAVREFVAGGAHLDRVSDAVNRVIAVHRNALDRLGE